MARVPSSRPSADGPVFHERLPGRPLATLLGPLLLLVALVALRGLPTAGPPTLLALTAGAETATPAELTATAAAVLEAALVRGSGIEFEIVQTSTITARPDGPLVDIPDPHDRGKTLGTAERYVMGTLIERGFATPRGLLDGAPPRPGPGPGGRLRCGHRAGQPPGPRPRRHRVSRRRGGLA